ncbi:MAG: hypothetical protein M1840_005901 [Geoglossum simile]|nr:MAG: hypothetical protein M1840_005901 [Geoglossum simile]
MLFHLAAFFLAALTAAFPHEKRESGLKAFDVSQAQAPNFWKCTHDNGYQKVAIRGWQEACGHGGLVDPNFVPSYQAAIAAGYAPAQIDAYMYPCTGNQVKTGVPCKSVSEQLNEFLTAIKDNHVIVHRLWLDIETEPDSSPCNGWNLGKDANLALAKEWTAALRATGLKWGIYANGNEWSSLFPSRDSDIGSDLPLWAVQDDGNPGVATVTTFMGGWKTALAKQYLLPGNGPPVPAAPCGGSVDLDSFLE